MIQCTVFVLCNHNRKKHLAKLGHKVDDFIIFFTLQSIRLNTALADEALTFGPQAGVPCRYWDTGGGLLCPGSLRERERGDKKD